MRVLYFTNPDVTDIEVIPRIVRATGDTVLTHTRRLALADALENNIDFIVSDRSRYLLKKDLIDHLPRRIVNLHPSFLPWNRGYHPNYWSIKERTPFGVTLHFIDPGIDTGNILAQTRVFYDANDSLRATYDRLRRVMVGLFEVCWPLVRLGALPDSPQPLDAGTIHYKRDFDGVFERLAAGWDTTVREIQA